jgi:hypothetical protein
MARTYSTPTAQQLEEARAYTFIVDAQKALVDEYRLYGVTLGMEVEDRDQYGNQTRRLTAQDRTGATVDLTSIHPNHSPKDTAYYVACAVRAARSKAAITEKA